MGKRTNKQISAILFALALMVSALSVGSSKSFASVDGSDTGSRDGWDVSGNVAGKIQTEAFLVTDSAGEIFGSYDKWEELTADFKVKGDGTKEYVISVLPEAVIGKAMPSKAASITLRAAGEEKSTIYFAGSTLNMTTPLVVEAQALRVADTDKAVNINTKGRQLTLTDVRYVGTVKGTSKGSLLVRGAVQLQGNLQTFRNLTVEGSLRVRGNVSAISNLILENGTVYLEAGKSFAVTNVDASAEGVLGYPANGKLPAVRISGNVSGVLALKQFEEVHENFVEREFTAGSRLLTANKAAVEQFSLTGERQVCYKVGSVLYVGAEVLKLYKGDEYLGVYARWNDLRLKINALKDKTASYRVVLLDDYVVDGALSMPTKGRYADILLENGKGSPLQLRATGNLTLTANLTCGQGITLEAKQISGTAWNIKLDEGSSLITTGNITAKNLNLGRNAWVQTGGKLTVKSVLEAAGGNELILTYKKAAAVKDTVATDKIGIKLLDKEGNPVTAPFGTTVVNVTGNSYATQYCLWDDKGAELALYRKGNTLRVKGNVATPISLYDQDGEAQAFLGEYATLADARNEIARRNKKQGEYLVHVSEEVLVKGTLPLPKAGTYKTLTFTGERIRVTSNITLTGDVSFTNVIQRIKGEQDVTPLPLTVKLVKYKLSISREIDNLAAVTGSAGSALEVGIGVQQMIDGNLKADDLTLAGELQVKGDMTVTDIYPQAGNRLEYDLAEEIVIKGKVYGAVDKLLLNPVRNGSSSGYTEDMKILPNAPKVVVSGLLLARETEWVLYRDNGAVRLGRPLLTVFENTGDYESVQGAFSAGHRRFARVTDALEYINALEGTDYVIRLDADIPSPESLKSPDKGKNVVICGAPDGRRTMKITGSIVVDAGNLHIHDMVLNNGKANGPGVILINKAQIHLCDVSVNTITAPSDTGVTLEGQVVIKGSVAGACDMTLMENAVVRAENTIAVNTLTLKAQTEGTAQLRISLSKGMTVNSTITTPEKGRFIVNRVDKNNELAGLSEGTVMLTAPYGQSTQFKTQNTMPGTFMEWALIKKGNQIQTSEASQGDGEWSGDFL